MSNGICCNFTKSLRQYNITQVIKKATELIAFFILRKTYRMLVTLLVGIKLSLVIFEIFRIIYDIVNAVVYVVKAIIHK